MPSPPPNTVNNPPPGGSGAVADPHTYAGKVAAGGARRAPQLATQPAPLPIPTHGHSPLTVLIDLQSAKATANRDDRSRFVLLQLGVDPQAVTSLFVEPVTQLYAVTFNCQEAFRAAVDKLRRGVAWPLAAGKVVFGWPASEGLQKVRVTAVPDLVTVDQLSAHMAQFGHVLKAERGRDKLFLAAFDGVVHLNIQLLQGATLPNFLAIREEGRTLLNVAYVFSDLHKKACFRCGQMAHLGQYCRAAVKPIADQVLVWSFLDLPAREPVVDHSIDASGRSRAEPPSTPGGQPPSPPRLGSGSGSREEELPLGQGPRWSSSGSPGGDTRTGLVDREDVDSASAGLEPSANPGLGGARLVREPASTSGPSFRVVSGVASEDFPPLTLPPPL
jgi:hypothetical protein